MGQGEPDERDKKVLPLIYASLERPTGTPNLRGQLCNDAGNGERLAALHGHDLRYSHDIRKWLVWDTHRWGQDNTGEAQRLSKLTIRQFVRQALKEN